jgi:C1A family cysteine protease
LFGIYFDRYLDHQKNVGAIWSMAYNRYNLSQERKGVYVLTKKIADDIKTRLDPGTHEILVTGYNDDLCVSSSLGQAPQCGLLTIRNYFGSKMGNKDNFYMTYTYYKALTGGNAIAIGSHHDV